MGKLYYMNRIEPIQAQRLTDRDRQYMHALANHPTAKHVARVLGVSPATVYTIQKRIAAKLELESASRFELLRAYDAA